MSDDRLKGLGRQASGKIESTVGDLTGDTKSQAQGRMDDLAGQAQRTYGQAKDAVQDAASSLNESVGGAGNQAQRSYGRARDTVRDATNQMSQNGGDYASSMLDQVEEYGDYIAEQVDQRPVTAVLIAAGVGFLLAMITKPSTRTVYRRR